MRLKLNTRYAIAAFILFLIEIIIAMTLEEGFIRYTFGDYLATILLYCLIRSSKAINPQKIIIITLFISYGIEWLQFTNILKTVNLEHSNIIKTLLGSSFSIGDLIAYTLGGTTIYIIDYKTQKP